MMKTLRLLSIAAVVFIACVDRVSAAAAPALVFEQVCRNATLIAAHTCDSSYRLLAATVCGSASPHPGCAGGFFINSLVAQDSSEEIEQVSPCCAGHYCSPFAVCMLPCSVGAYCPSPLRERDDVCYPTVVPPDALLGCGGAHADVLCPAKLFCEEPTAAAFCPKSSICKTGTSDPSECPTGGACAPRSRQATFNFIPAFVVALLCFVYVGLQIVDSNDFHFSAHHETHQDLDTAAEIHAEINDVVQEDSMKNTADALSPEITKRVLSPTYNKAVSPSPATSHSTSDATTLFHSSVDTRIQLLLRNFSLKVSKIDPSTCQRKVLLRNINLCVQPGRVVALMVGRRANVYVTSFCALHIGVTHIHTQFCISQSIMFATSILAGPEWRWQNVAA
jgi:hypothetical protein